MDRMESLKQMQFAYFTLLILLTVYSYFDHDFLRVFF